jgi:hypothetical protein
MATLGGFELEYHPISNSSLQDYDSAWTSCVADVAAGILDLCVANVWITPDRLELGATFVTPATSDRFKLLSESSRTKPTLRERLWTPFAPFSQELWASIFITWVVVGFLYSMFGAHVEFEKDLVLFKERKGQDTQAAAKKDDKTKGEGARGAQTVPAHAAPAAGPPKAKDADNEQLLTEEDAAWLAFKRMRAFGR